MKIVWSRRAVLHLQSLREFIAQDSLMNASRVAARILEAVSLLESHPDAGRPGRIIATRELVVTGTPCLIPYRIRHDCTELIAVLHGRQQWRQRL